MSRWVRAAFTLSTLVWLASCGDEDPPAQNGSDSGAAKLCDPDNPCTAPEVCVGGVCQLPGADAGGDGGRVDRAEIELCTPDGCQPPYRLNFGGSRIGVTSTRNLTVRSAGVLPLEVRTIGVATGNAEFSSDPTGTIDQVLQPGEELVVRVSHTAADGRADNDRLEIISNAADPRVLVDLITEYKGVPTLFVGANPAVGTGEVLTVDFGNVRAGQVEVRQLFLKNRDNLIDGSILEVREVRTEPQSSSNFRLAIDQTLPAYLNQFNSLCMMDSACRQDLGDRCDVAQGVCATSTGPLRDVLTATITFVGATVGQIQETLVILSNDGGQGQAVRMIQLRANVTVGELDIMPDPVEFTESFVGYTDRRTVTLSNAGTAPLVISELSLADSSTFALDLGGATLPLTIAPMSAASVAVTFTPPAPGTYATTLLVTDDASGPQMVNVTGNAYLAPVMELDPTSINFGETHVGANTAISVRVRNTGGYELRVPSLTTTATVPEFSVDRPSLGVIMPGNEVNFLVRYNPTLPSHPAFQRAIVEIVSNDPARQPLGSVPLVGRGVDPTAFLVQGNVVDFNRLGSNPNNPSIYFAQQLTTRLTLTNTGRGPLVVTAISIANDPRSAYTLLNPPVFPVSLDTSQTLDLDLRYAPPSAGNDAATQLQIATNDLGFSGGVVTASLVGVTTDCPGRTGATGVANAAGVCGYACSPGFVDLDQDLASPNSNGCEYTCSVLPGADLPDDTFTDANCDGIDGDAGAAIFVSVNGSDAFPGTRAQPMRTVNAAVGRAQTQGLSQVYVSNGTYLEQLSLVNGVSIYGGYSATSVPRAWARSDAFEAVLSWNTIQGGRVIGAVGGNITAPTTIDHLTIRAGNALVTQGSSYGLHCNGCNGLTIRRSIIESGAAGPGPGGSVGATGANGGNGGNGGSGNCDAGPAGFRGAPGASTCGRPGGQGGLGGNEGCSNGETGGQGAGGTAGGGGGSYGECNIGFCVPCCGDESGNTGGQGGQGAAGSAGNNGAGGAGGFVSLGFWITNGGSNGGLGGAGNGGGGGGGGGGQCGSYPNDGAGNGGGGGGAGGCGGGGGFGGGGGGGSFALFLVNSTGITLSASAFVSGNGGPGGAGGNAGGGGLPGSRGLGGTTCTGEVGAGGPGGNGGGGGRGGHGGGGAGGPSYSVYRSNTTVSIAGNTLTFGQGGLGGASSGNRGNDGLAAGVN